MKEFIKERARVNHKKIILFSKKFSKKLFNFNKNSNLSPTIKRDFRKVIENTYKRIKKPKYFINIFSAKKNLNNIIKEAETKYAKFKNERKKIYKKLRESKKDEFNNLFLKLI